MAGQPLQNKTLTVPQIRASAQQIGIGLYVVTFLLELPGALIRFGLVWGFFALLAGINRFIAALGFFIARLQQATGDTANQPPSPIIPLSVAFDSVSGLLTLVSSVTTWAVFALSVGPLLFSIASFFLPGGFFFRKFALNARSPSIREQEMFEDARGALTSSGLKLLYPTHLYIIDNNPRLEASVIGSTVYVTRTALRSPLLVPILAHALGHVNSLDGRLTLALRRLVLAPVYVLSNGLGQAAPGLIRVSTAAGGNTTGCLAGGVLWILSLLLAVAAGGIGSLLLSPVWAWFWRQREYAADDFAVKLGQGEALQQYLEDNQTFDIAVPYLLTQVPSSELRIDRLTYPTMYSAADSLNITPFLTGGVALILVLCGFPVLLSGIEAIRSDISGDYILAGACRGDCDPIKDDFLAAYANTHDEYVSVSGDRISVNASNATTFYGSQLGIIKKLGNDTIVVQSTEGASSYQGLMLLNETFRIEKRGDYVILHGQLSSFALARVGSRAETDLKAQRSSYPTPETLAGQWRGMSGAATGTTLTFMQDGSFTIAENSGATTTGNYTTVGRSLRFSYASGGFMDVTAQVKENQLVINNGNEETKYERLN